MQEYAQKPEKSSSDSNSRSSGQPPISEILQAYKNRTLQRISVDEEELLQAKTRDKSSERETLQLYKEYTHRDKSGYNSLIQGMFDIPQRKGIEDEELLQGKFDSSSAASESTVQREVRPNNTGLPDNLKSGIENLSGYSMDDVKVHYNSDKPAQLSALAYAQGTDIHVAPGQERHLPHEAWHVVQQKQGRVQPTMQMQGVDVNDNAGLEREADMMGEKSENRDLHCLNSKNSLFHLRNSSTKQLKIKVGLTTFPREGKSFDDEVDYIFKKLSSSGFISYGKKNYSYIDEAIDHKLYIKELLVQDEIITNKSYNDLVPLVWKYISLKLAPPLPLPLPTFMPFSMEDFDAASSNVGEGPSSIFRPLSPIRGNIELIRDWKADNGSHHFSIRGSKTVFNFGGPGKFLTGVGSYEELISNVGEDAFVNQLRYLLFNESDFDATKIHPSVKAAYALIIAVEGCARSTHNIAVASIFIANFNIIKSKYNDKGLLELMNMFLTFSPIGGAASSKNYDININELKLIAAHLQANSINTDDTVAIGKHLAGIVLSVLNRADLRSTISTEYNETPSMPFTVSRLLATEDLGNNTVEHHYSCPCGEGLIKSQIDETPGHHDHYTYIDCSECKSKYLIDNPDSGAWSVILKD